MTARTAIRLQRFAQIFICAIVLLEWLPGRAEAGENAAAACAYRPDNIHRAAKTLPEGLRRVVVLPLASTLSADLTAGCEALAPILIEELNKSKRFEVVSVDPQSLKRATGQASWTGEERLPANLLSWLTDTFGCDAVLIPQLTTYRGYPPLAVGWRFKLVDTRTGQILWASDEVFDAGRSSVVSGAKRYNRRENGAKCLDDGWSVLRCPRRFGRYSAATLLALLPER